MRYCDSALYVCYNTLLPAIGYLHGLPFFTYTAWGDLLWAAALFDVGIFLWPYPGEQTIFPIYYMLTSSYDDQFKFDSRFHIVHVAGHVVTYVFFFTGMYFDLRERIKKIDGDNKIAPRSVVDNFVATFPVHVVARALYQVDALFVPMMITLELGKRFGVASGAANYLVLCRQIVALFHVCRGAHFVFSLNPLAYDIDALGKAWADVDISFRWLYFAMRMMMGAGQMGVGIAGFYFLNDSEHFMVVCGVYGIFAVIVNDFLRVNTRGSPPVLTLFAVALLTVVCCY